MTRESYHTDAAHGRTIPTGRRLRVVLERILRRQAQEARAALNAGRLPNLQAWLPVMAETLTPLYAELALWGARRAAKQLPRKSVTTGRHKGSSYFCRQVYPPIHLKAVGAVGSLFDPSLTTGFDVFNRRVLDAVQEAVLKFCQSTIDTLIGDIQAALTGIRGTLGAGLEGGETTAQLNRRVGKIVNDPLRASRIAQTEASRAMHAGQYVQAQAVGATGKRWVLSSDACSECQEMGQRGTIPIDEPFYVDPKGGQYAVCMFPPRHPFCLPGETPVFAPGAVGSFVSHYRGSVVRITLDSGDNFACTPNHMLLSRGGFLRAATFVQGDDVIYCPLTKLVGSAGPNNHRLPSRIDEVVDSLSVTGGVSSYTVPVAAEYLHGDGAFCQGNVDVVRSDSLLRGDSEWHVRRRRRNEHVDELAFGWIDDHSAFVADSDVFPPLLALANAINYSMASGPGVARERGSLLLAHLRHANKVSLPERARLNACRGQSSANYASGHAKGGGNRLFSFTGGVARQYTSNIDGVPHQGHRFFLGSDDNPTLDEPLLDGLAVDADSLSQCLARFPGQITTSKIIDITIEHFEGPVYDLETETSMYIIGNGVVSSNCMCSFIEVME